MKCEILRSIDDKIINETLKKLEDKILYKPDVLPIDDKHNYIVCIFYKEPDPEITYENALKHDIPELRRLIILARQVDAKKFNLLTNATQREIYLLANHSILKKDVDSITALLKPDMASVLAINL
jgi:hypothetical protein